MYKRLVNFFIRFNVLSHQQFGFQRGKSCVDAVGQLLDFVYSAINNKKYIISIFLDLRKAYDTMNNKILLDKLEAYEIRRCALNWFKTYLSNRIQRVFLGDTVSDPNEKTP